MAGADPVTRTTRHDTLTTPAHRFGLLALGLALLLCGAAAVMLPALSTIAASKVLGAALAIAGAVTLVQAFQLKGWVGFLWQLLCGTAEVVIGLLVWFNPLTGAAVITLLIGIVLAVQGVAQLILAVKLRPQRGWLWLGLASLFSLAVCAVLALRFPFTSVETPGAMAGLALAVAGLAYVVMGIGRLKVGSPPLPTQTGRRA